MSNNLANDGEQRVVLRHKYNSLLHKQHGKHSQYLTVSQTLKDEMKTKVSEWTIVVG